MIFLFRSARQSYGDNAIGYVQLSREGEICNVFSKVTPEHKINAKNYVVSCKINEKEHNILEVMCQDCAASEGGCKHAVAFVMWLYRRSEEPSPTDKVCYWKKSVLSGATTTKKFVTIADFGSRNDTSLSINEGHNLVYDKYINEAKKRKIENCITRYHIDDPLKKSAALHYLKHQFMATSLDKVAQEFINFCKVNMTPELLKTIEMETRNQSESKLWMEMRYGRITASKAYEVAHCHKKDGVLVEKILGAKVFQTKAMKRGLKLEDLVIEELKKKTKKSYKKAGLFLSREIPIIGASPDFITDDSVIEIKCPSFEKTFLNYIDNEGKIKEKPLYQIQLQMHLAEKKTAVFVVANHDFETTKKITVKVVAYDKNLVEKIIYDVMQFWSDAVFAKL